MLGGDRSLKIFMNDFGGMAFKLWPLNFVCVLAWIVGFGGRAKIPENVLFGA